MKINFIILLLSGYFNYILSKNPEFLTISVYENSFKKQTYNITLVNQKNAKISKEPSKLLYITDIENKDLSTLNEFSRFYNRIWLFYVTDVAEIPKIFQKNYFNTRYILITGLIMPESLVYKNMRIDENEKIPVYTIEDRFNETLINYDLRNNKKNVYFVINYAEQILISFLIGFSAFALLSAIGIGVTWHYLEKKIGPTFIFGYHERIKYIICAHIFLALTLIFKTISIMKTENYELTIAVEISLYLSVSFFRSLLWFLIYLISFGWNICFQDFGMNEQRRIFKIFIFVAIFFFIDNILDKYCGKLWVLYVSEIKNVILFGILTFLTYRNINKNMIFLKRKYNYALTLLEAYAEGINEKIKLLTYLRYEIIGFLPLLVLIIIINKLSLSNYDNPILLLYIYLIPDLLLEFVFVFLMRPKVVPAYYSVDLGDMFNQVEGSTYLCVLPKYDEFNEEQMVEDIKDKINFYDENIPIIIFGPEKTVNNSLFEEDASDRSGYIESDINKYFSNIRIGYKEKNE